MATVAVNQPQGRPRAALVPLRDWAVEVGEWVINYLEGNNRVTSKSNTAANTLEVSVLGVDTVTLTGGPSVGWALAGRKAGKFPPPQNIRDWIVDKPVPFDPLEISLNSLAFLIGRKIAESGTSEPKLRQQNFQIVVNNLGKKYTEQIGQIQAKAASAAMVQLLTRNIPNTTKK